MQRFPAVAFVELCPWINGGGDGRDDADVLPLEFGDEAAGPTHGDAIEHGVADDTPLDFHAADERALEVAALPTPELPLHISVQGSVYVPGVLHILHNLTCDLRTSMVSWAWFVDKCVVIGKLVSRPWWRQRMEETCFADPPHVI